VAYRRHFFVCTTERPPFGKPSCGQQGSAAIVAALLGELDKRPELAGTVEVSTSSCLGPCFEGPTVVVYPEGTWYTGVRPEDAREIGERHMAGGEPVERLKNTIWSEPPR
jgi:(2Fe-2S) ferredoxin